MKESESGFQITPVNSNTPTLETLKNTPDDKLDEWLYHYCISQMGDFSKEREAFDKLPKGLQILFSTSTLENEVNNGGFHQYFFNSQGEFAQDALEGLRKIGAEAHAMLHEQAIAIYRQEEAAMMAQKEMKSVEAFVESAREEKFDKLDRQFYKLDALSPLRVRYIRAHMEEFVP